MNGKPTIVLIHGLWVTPQSWDPFRGHYEAKGYEVLTPHWPGEPEGVDVVRRDPSGFAGMGITELVDHHERIVRALDAPPILIGHSYGGLVVQMLLDRGLGASGVAIDSVPPKGVLLVQPAVLRSCLPVLWNPLNLRRTKRLSFGQFRYNFANAMSEAEARGFYEREAVPGPGRPLFQSATSPFNSISKIDYRKSDRAPLLLVAGSEDHQITPSVVRWNHKNYGGPATVEYREFAGRGHLICAQEGWQEVADASLDWATAHLSPSLRAPDAPTVTLR